MKIFLRTIMPLTFLWLAFSGQSQPVKPIDTSRQSVAYWQNWLTELTDMGVEKKKDSFFVKQEVIHLMKDSVYRKSIYPSVYDWKGVTELLKKMELKKAFWHLINLYQSDTAHRDITVGTFILYDSLIEMDKALLGSFYTYAFTDPRVCKFVNGKPEIYRPDILEKNLRVTKDIVNIIWGYRQKKQQIGSKR